jgi:primosomal protein N' (replication factor Y)
MASGWSIFALPSQKWTRREAKLLLDVVTDKQDAVVQQGKGFAQVVIPSPLKDALTYAVPPSLEQQLEVGMRVLVPLGRRRVTGVIMEFCARAPVKDIREVLEPLDERPVLDSALLQLCRWTARYYLAPLGEVIGAVLPAGLRVENQTSVVIANSAAAVPEGRGREVFDELRGRRKIPLKSLMRKFAGTNLSRLLDDLVSCGAVEIREGWRGRRAKVAASEPAAVTSPTQLWQLNAEQETALKAISERVEKGGFETFLLFGITGSGKTEVYLRALEAAQKRGKRSLILVPEISLTPQLLDRIRARFPERVGVLHSGLSPAERRRQWWRMTRGDVTVAVGARSAVFAPVPDLGLIIVDEEHDPSYKQEEGLRYHARDLAVVRGQSLGCAVVLGSATPSLESFQNGLEKRYRLLELPRRVAERSLPGVQAVDLRPTARAQWERQNSGGGLIFSPALKDAIEENHRRGRQTLLFLNRRGFANFLQCRLCGFAIRCPHCTVTLTFHLRQRKVKCHHCGFQKLSEDRCPECGNSALSPLGVGTEQVERELAQLIPQARIARMDRDTTQRRGSHEQLLKEWEKGQIEILVGTQMIAKGHDVAGVTLVGVLLADLSLNVPDFRAAERTFQLLSQVAGRAGRGNDPGQVILQTFAPHHYALQSVITHDYRGFFRSEIEFRRALSYPPFARLALLRLDGVKGAEVERSADLLGARLREAARRAGSGADGIQILGPASAPIERLRGRYRYQILLKGKAPARVLDLARRAQSFFAGPRSIRLRVDVDPQNML